MSELRAVMMAPDFELQAHNLTEQWSTAHDCFAAVEPVLRIMEEYPKFDFGTPGPLVHFVERFYGRGYVQKLIDSVGRKPTAHTAWMLNRIINGTQDPRRKQALTDILKRARAHPLADEATKSVIDLLLE